MLSERKRFCYLVFIFICLALLLACKNKQSVTEQKVSLGALAEQYWAKRLIEKDYKFTYNLELDKESISFSEYLKIVESPGQIKVLSIKTKEVKMEDGKGLVQLTTKCRIPPAPRELELPMDDVWLYKSGEWKHHLPPRNSSK